MKSEWIVIFNICILYMIKDCYLKMDNFLSINLINEMKKNILSNNKINYKNFDIIVIKIMKLLGKKFNCDPIPTKYRVSDGKSKKNSNSTDAANFHRDINVFENNENIDIYTLVMYLDNAKLEIIPNSCNIFNEKYLDTNKIIKFKKGDAILFNARMLHRGKFEIKSNSRTCIQIFEIYKNKSDFRKYRKKILTIPDTTNYNDLIISQNWYNIPFIYNYIKRKGKQVFVNKIKNNQTGFEYLSTDSQRPRAIHDIDEGNYYRLLEKTIDAKNPSKVYNTYIKYPLVISIVEDIIIFLTVIFILYKLNFRSY